MNDTRYCPKCQQMHPANNFYLRKGKPRGYCKPCSKLTARATYRSTDREVLRRQRQAWFDRQPQEYKDRVRARAARALAEKRAANLEAARAQARQSAAKRRASDLGMLRNRITAGMNASLARAGAKRKDWMNWEAIVGYTAEDLRAHLEAQFKDGMSWENRREWHIDHIRPLASFSFTGPTDPEFKRAWALSNLQPLWAPDNQKKHAKWAPGVHAI